MGKLSGRSIVLIALCVGLLAAGLAYVFLNQKEAQAAKMTEPVQVVVTTQDIPVRTVIEPGMVREATQPVGTLPANPATSVSEVLGRVTLEALPAKAPVRRSSVAARNASLGLAYMVPEGMRAVTVALDSIIGVAGFLKAGDHVDVLATFNVDKVLDNKVAVTKTVLQDVELLAIGPEVVPAATGNPGDKDPRPKEQPNATLSLHPEDAEKLILAESEGKLRLTLRPMGDAAKVVLSGVRSDSLTGLRAGGTAVAAAPRASIRTMSTGYASPAFGGGYPPLGAGLYPDRLAESRPAPVTFADKAAEQPAVTVETVRGTQKTTVDVRSE